MVYFLLPTFAFVIFLIGQSNIKNAKAYELLLLCILIVFVGIFGGLRYEVGMDWSAYKTLYDDSDRNIEFSYILISEISYWLGGGFGLLIFTYFLLGYILKLWYLIKMSPSLALSLMLYLGFWFLVYDMNGIRQGVALGCIGVAYYYVLKMNLAKFLLLTSVAAFFHSSAIIFFPFYFLIRFSISHWWLIVIVATSFILASIGVTEYIISKFITLIGVDANLALKAISYVLDDAYNQSNLFSFTTIHRFGVFFLVLFSIRKLPIDERFKRIILYGITVNIVLYLLFSQFSIIATRTTLYFRFVELLFFAYLPFIFKKISNRFFIGFILWIYILWQVHQTMVIQDNGLLPYQNVLFQIF